mgnify:CR=1 FL=1
MTGIEIMEIDRDRVERDRGRDSRDRRSERETQGDSVTGTERDGERQRHSETY